MGAAVILARYFLVAIILCGLVSPVRSAGIQLLDSDPNLAGAIWYPCAATAQSVPLGRLSVQFLDRLDGAKDCPVSGHRLPLVILSHGRGGWFGGHNDLAEALADAGFVVAAINHSGDNGNDSSKRDSLPLLQSRPQDMVRLLDFMLHGWKDRASIDPARAGLFGFSAGGTTGLVLAGVDPDFDRLARLCTDKVDACEALRRGERLPGLPHDPRIRAAVIVDPPSTLFTRENLTAIAIPLQFWRSEQGGGGVNAEGTARVAGELPGRPEIHAVRAGHYAFLPPCTAPFAANLPRFCTDPPGFDRAAFHRDFNAHVTRFFRQTLVGP
jgi:predicted dienelactone hydrolase